MAGLLYKDFVAVKGKIWVSVILAALVLLLFVKVTVPTESIDLIVTGLSVCIIAGIHLFVVGRLEISVISDDETRKQRNYFLSLPVSKRQYVASKYLFLLITFGGTIAACTLLCSICRINCQYEQIEQLMRQLMSVVPVFTCVFLLIPAFELPFFIGLGTAKGNQIRTGFLIILFFIVLIVFMFGSLSALEEIDLVSALDYLEKHTDIFLILQVIIPYAVLGLFYVSYRISCVLFERREDWEDD